MKSKIDTLSLTEGDTIVTIDWAGYESVEIVTCVDNGLWTKGILDDTEIFESWEELESCYKYIIKL